MRINAFNINAACQKISSVQKKLFFSYKNVPMVNLSFAINFAEDNDAL